MMSHNMHNEFVFVSQSITKKRTFGQMDCTIWETREVRERSDVFIKIRIHACSIGKYQSSRRLKFNIPVLILEIRGLYV